MKKEIIGSCLMLMMFAGVNMQCKPAAEQRELPVEAVLELDSTRVGISTLISDLNVPWEIAWGPDDQIWFTEQSGTVSKVDPKTGIKKQLIAIPEVYRQRSLGLLGMAVSKDPEQPYVFVDYTHMNADSSIVSRLVRYTYTADTLKDPFTLIELPGNTGHNGSRVAIAPDGKVFLSTGDAANGLNAPDTASINGKTLRFNFDGSIPADNPYRNSPVWSSGHRNIQGLVFSDKGHLFASEHGDAIEDEVNYIQRRHYYGWPFIEGPADLPAEKAHADSFAFTAPMRSWTPTIAPAGVDYYGSRQIPEWHNSILLGTLKAASLRVLSLNEAQDSILKEEIYFAGKFGRLRDICVAPNGDIYIATSNRDWNPGKGFPLLHDDRIIRLSALQPGTKIPATAEILKAAASQAAGISKGQSLYKNYCESCHKPDGKGVPGSFPSLDQSAVVNGPAAALIRTVLNGKTGANPGEQMPAFAFLKDDEIAALLTYIRGSWNNRADSVPVAAISRLRSSK